MVAVVFATLGLLTPLHTCKHPIKALRTAGDEYLWDESYSEQLMILPCMRIVYEVTEMEQESSSQVNRERPDLYLFLQPYTCKHPIKVLKSRV